MMAAKQKYLCFHHDFMVGTDTNDPLHEKDFDRYVKSFYDQTATLHVFVIGDLYYLFNDHRMVITAKRADMTDSEFEQLTTAFYRFAQEDFDAIGRCQEYHTEHSDLQCPDRPRWSFANYREEEKKTISLTGTIPRDLATPAPTVNYASAQYYNQVYQGRLNISPGDIFTCLEPAPARQDFSLTERQELLRLETLAHFGVEIYPE